MIWYMQTGSRRPTALRSALSFKTAKAKGQCSETDPQPPEVSSSSRIQETKGQCLDTDPQPLKRSLLQDSKKPKDFSGVPTRSPRKRSVLENSKEPEDEFWTTSSSRPRYSTTTFKGTENQKDEIGHDAIGPIWVFAPWTRPAWQTLYVQYMLRLYCKPS